MTTQKAMSLRLNYDLLDRLTEYQQGLGERNTNGFINNAVRMSLDWIDACQRDFEGGTNKHRYEWLNSH